MLWNIHALYIISQIMLFQCPTKNSKSKCLLQPYCQKSTLFQMTSLFPKCLKCSYQLLLFISWQKCSVNQQVYKTLELLGGEKMSLSCSFSCCCRKRFLKHKLSLYKLVHEFSCSILIILLYNGILDREHLDLEPTWTASIKYECHQIEETL